MDKLAIINYVNSNEFFWQHDLKALLGIEGEGSEAKQFFYFMGQLRKYKFIQCAEVKGQRKQYYRVEPIRKWHFKLLLTKAEYQSYLTTVNKT